MENEIQSANLEQKELLKQDEQENAPDSDGMDAVEPDRVGDDGQGSFHYGVNTDVSASSVWADRFNANTGEVENLSDENGLWISNLSSLSTKADKQQWLNKKYEPKEPIVKKVGDPAPKLEDLVTVGQGTLAEHVDGTPEHPNVFNKVVPYSLFIDGKADQNGIRQGNLGDCYFLSALLQVIHYDPNFLPSIMSIHGDEVYVTWRLIKKEITRIGFANQLW